ncbi:hypothetical protein A1353_22900 [Methylomonas methanica]|uniref:Uncharacterized protein n=1 Tax=Methylomonas methanica TaxID=421 RepID=A0A177LWN3_METMH|nr:hypothetical protein [Methylomonas methanica]OAH97444.1 hypothetical protein A1353_22900 [Methylomonas methanica]
MYELLMIVVGGVLAVYVTAEWGLHFLELRHWLGLILTVSTPCFIAVGLMLKLRWAFYLLAAAIGITSALFVSGNFKLLLPA